jgi:hypothetical protein
LKDLTGYYHLMASDEVTIEVTDDQSSDKARLDDSVLQLREQLLDIPHVGSVRSSLSVPEESAKSSSAYIVGSLVVTMSVSASSFTVLFKFLREWLKRNEGKKVTLTRKGEVIEIAGLSESSIKELLSRWDLSADQRKP